jgi:hypothetical protein
MLPVLATLGALIVVTHTVRHLAGWFGERWGGLPMSTALTLSYCLWEHGPPRPSKPAWGRRWPSPWPPRGA